MKFYVYISASAGVNGLRWKRGSWAAAAATAYQGGRETWRRRFKWATDVVPICQRMIVPSHKTPQKHK